jgi:L-rhamnose-H+ transport protein
MMLSVGGIAHGTFYAPLKKVRKWSWESGWLVQGLAAWLITPWLVALLADTDPMGVFRTAPIRSMLLTYLFGVMWGFGSLTFGLTMRYLGMSLGMAVALGFCATFGTLLPPIVSGNLNLLLFSGAGRFILGGIAMCLLGIAQCGWAGIRKERELTEEQKKEGVREFALLKGFVIAVFSGIMSAGFAYAISAGKPLAEQSLALGAPEIMKNAPVFILVMGGGLTVNATWCILLNIRNRSYRDYLGHPSGLLGRNVLFAALSGIIWYTGFFFYGMGTTFMGEYDFSSWSIHLAFVILFSTLCGILMREWKGVSRKTMRTVYAGLLLLLLSTVVTAIGNGSAPH